VGIQILSGLREAAGGDMGDPRFSALIDKRSAASDRFRGLWAFADVGYRTGIFHFLHPLFGDLYLHRNRLSVPHSGGQQLLIYQAEPGIPSVQALEELRSLAPLRGKFEFH
jgi:hypothetical protein